MLTWTDQTTNLEWQVDPASPMDWRAAEAHASSLEGNWRLPTREELESISGEARPKELMGNGFFLSSSLVENHDFYRWYVGFDSGSTYASHYDNITYVRCVREVQE